VAQRSFQEYSPSWPEEFRRERESLASAMGDAAVEIDHVGSTAIPGMPGKGIIDILVTVHSLDPPAYDAPLRRLGYIDRPVDRPDPFYTKPAVKPRTHNVHVAVVDSPRAKSLRAFRDYLTEHPQEAGEYEQLKRALADRPDADWDNYSQRKLELAEKIESRATAWAEDRRSR
jgi:GrpB-like predicted nucleotidyltransferase (UPF0157 family)